MAISTRISLRGVLGVLASAGKKLTCHQQSGNEPIQ